MGKKCITGLLIVLFSSIAQASLISFDDRALWQAAAGDTVLNNLNSLSASSFRGISLDAGDFSLFQEPGRSGIGSSGSFNGLLTTGGFSDIDGSQHARLGTRSGLRFTLTFDNAITSIGFDVTQFNDTIFRTRILAGDTELVDSDRTGNTRFIGLVSDVEFTVLTFLGVENDGWGMDNIEYTFALDSSDEDSMHAPEPSIIGLFGLALLAMRRFRRR